MSQTFKNCCTGGDAGDLTQSIVNSIEILSGNAAKLNTFTNGTEAETVNLGGVMTKSVRGLVKSFVDPMTGYLAQGAASAAQSAGSANQAAGYASASAASAAQSAGSAANAATSAQRSEDFAGNAYVYLNEAENARNGAVAAENAAAETASRLEDLENVVR